jgi:hypothetical protein
VRFAGPDVGSRSPVAAEHLAGSPAGQPHQIGFGTTLGQPGVSEGMAELVPVQTGQGRPARPAAHELLDASGGQATRDERRSSSRLWRQLDCRATGRLREHLPPRQPTEASPRPARCEEETQRLAPARLARNYAFCLIYLLFRRR